MCLVNYTEMARVTGVPFSYLLSRGQQIKVISQLFRKCLQEDIVIPNLKSEGSNEEYEGATVIEPERGYYDVPIATLDFSSLYPSIMMAHNLCYTTLLNKNSIKAFGLTEDDYTKNSQRRLLCTFKFEKRYFTHHFGRIVNCKKKAKADLKKKQILSKRCP